LNSHFQYIIKDYAENSDFSEFLADVSPKDRELLTTVFNWAKMSTLDQFDFLGGALGNKN
jgi:hypothetical protein